MRHTIVILQVCILAILGLSSCQPRFRIGVSQCLDDAWRQKMNHEMQRELLLHPELSMYTRIAYGSNELQCAQIDSFIAERVDLLIVSPNETEAVKPAVSRAYRAGIPVIVADRRVTGNEWTAFIGGDNYAVGELMAQWLRSLQSEKGNTLQVLEVTGTTGSAPASLRHAGMMDNLADSTSEIVINSITGNWYQDNAYTIVSEFLKYNKRIDAIVAHNDLMAIGASDAVRDSKGYGEGSVHIMGVDCIRLGLLAIADGKIDCSATYSSRGDLLIETAANILAHEPFVRDTVLQTMMIDAASARPMLLEYDARLHDLETLQLVQVQSDQRWRKMIFDRAVLISIVVLFFALLIMAFGYIFFRQRKLQTEIKREILPQLEEMQEAVNLSHRDVAFAERMKQIVNDHLTDPNFSVEDLGSMLQLSRTQIFRRVKAVTGKGPLEYIRECRLKRAEQLLKTTDMTIQQVANELCFSSPGYFTKCYKDYFGTLPSKR